ncbi:hypothetical protein Q0N12_19540 [Rossellomorea marisflavi]|uniref:hypothetical protein n=1 Tax=Rossellomorea marisflavi TaxID=189381 RepID=UPI00345B42A5
MPSISRIRFTNVLYEEGNKRYNDELFTFDGHNCAILLENGGGKTVFIQAALQAVFPRSDLAERKIKQTLHLDRAPAHIAVEWILSDQPRRYLVTAVSLFLHNQSLDSYHYVYEYEANNAHAIDQLPFVRETMDGSKRAATRDEIKDYYQERTQRAGYRAETFQTIKAYREHLEETYHIIANEWDSIIKINSTEGGVETFFEDCKTTGQLFDRLLIPTVEASIAGHEKKTFADTFEKRREQFKRYKSLKAQIEENKRIESELAAYVSQFEKLYGKEQHYDAAKRETKGLFRLIETERTDAENEKARYEAQFEEWQKKKERWNKSEASFKVLEKREKHDESVRQSAILNEDHDRLEKEYIGQQHTYYSLKLAEHKQMILNAEEKKKHLEEELERLDEETGADELRDRLDETRAALHGNFVENIEETARTIASLKIEQQPLTNEISRLTGLFEESMNKRQKAQDEFSQYKGQIQMLDQTTDNIRQSILSKPDQETVEEKTDKWKQQEQMLDQQIVRFKDENKRLDESLRQLDKSYENCQSALTQVEKESSETDTNLNLYESKQQQVINRLGRYKPKWSNLGDLYLKEELIQSELREALSRQQKEYERTLHKERLALRFVDDYGKQELFFAEPFIDNKVDDWQNQFSFLVTGVQYIESLTDVDVNMFPYWTISLVTTTQEKGVLMRKVQEHAAHLSQPLFIFSTNEITQILKSEITVQEGIVPGHWPANMDMDSFRAWQANSKQASDEATQTRKIVEDEIQVVRQLINLFQDFTEHFPYESKQELIENKQQFSNLKQSLTDELRTIIQTTVKHQETIAHHQKEINNSSDKLNGLRNKLSKALEYERHKKERNHLETKQQTVSEQVYVLETEQKRIKQQRSKLQDGLEHLAEEIRDKTVLKQQLENDPLFQKVKDTFPAYTSASKEVLADQFEDLSFQLRGISRQRREVEENLSFEKKTADREQEASRALQREHADLNEALVFPIDGKVRMQKISSHFGEMKGRLKQLKKDLDDATGNMREWKGQIQNAEDAFYERFPGAELMSFSAPLSDVPVELEKQKKQLAEKKQYINQQLAEVENQLERNVEADQKLQKYEIKHLFLHQSVEAKDLSEEQHWNYTYNRDTFVKKSIATLNDTFDALEAEKDKVAKAKNRFKLFCQDQVTDVQMRQMAIRGVDSKKKYEDVIQFKHHMNERILRAIRYNEETIRDADKELEQFVSHIHQHLSNLTDQLKVIPKKTKVKVDDSWKEIYHFTIPEWDETEGREQIRNHIDWILGELEKDQFFDTNGEEDQGKVRKEIEKWLDSKQLLRIVMNQDVMKVSCRKVTNDNRVSTKRHLWEQTNNWSGGEKWSKNMTLFLGLLKYISEKTHHVEEGKGRNRAVIMDNPFGKASSDHVLNPVFFIAEQLGFQILALTAHAEGKFLHDHFPVIYSCRLRSAKDASTKVMTKVRHLHTAYFQDHSPHSMERMGETEQIELF